MRKAYMGNKACHMPWSIFLRAANPRGDIVQVPNVIVISGNTVGDDHHMHTLFLLSPYGNGQKFFSENERGVD